MAGSASNQLPLSTQVADMLNMDAVRASWQVLPGRPGFLLRLGQGAPCAGSARPGVLSPLFIATVLPSGMVVMVSMTFPTFFLNLRAACGR